MVVRGAIYDESKEGGKRVRGKGLRDQRGKESSKMRKKSEIRETVV